MANMTIAQKKEYAKVLFLKEHLTQKEIAEKAGVSKVTINKWVNDGKWEQLKIGLSMGPEEQISNLHRQIAEINRTILTREKGMRYATPAEADTLGKLAATIKKLEGDIGIADLISCGSRFIKWLRPIDLDQTKTFARLWDAFVKDNIL